MKKKGLFLVLFIFILFYFFSFISGLDITNNILTGQATSQNVNVSIRIAPSLIIYSPENLTYITNQSILLNYSHSSLLDYWFNLDNGTNITLTSSNYYFNASEGTHTLYLYSNNSGFISVQSIVFYVNTTLFRVIYTQYEDQGVTPDFDHIPYEDLANLSVCLENIHYGKICFDGGINVIADENPSDGLVDIHRNSNISFILAGVNSTALPNFNKSATIWLYNLNFINPRILKDGLPCPSNICSNENYSGGILNFRVTSFSYYSAEESYVAPTTNPSPASGGGGSTSTIIPTSKIYDFNVDPALFKLDINQGASSEYKIVIKNVGNQGMTFDLGLSALNNVLQVSPSAFFLGPGESKEVLLSSYIPLDEPTGIYFSKLIINGGNLTKVVDILVNIKEANPLFGLNARAIDKVVSPGNNLSADITIIPKGGLVSGEAELYYSIKNFNGDIISFNTETINVNNVLDLNRELLVLKNTALGNYVLVVRLTSGGKEYFASDLFKVGSSELENPIVISSKNCCLLGICGGYILCWYWWVLIIIVLLLIIRWLLGKKQKKKRVVVLERNQRRNIELV